MPRFILPNSATIHNAQAFLTRNDPFRADGDDAVLEFHPTWVHVDPLALTMVAAWAAWCNRNGIAVKVENLGPHTGAAARMGLFEQLGDENVRPLVESKTQPGVVPLTRVRTHQDVAKLIGNVPDQLQMHDDPESIAAVQYCVSELVRNALEHSGSPDGAFICATRHTSAPPHRVTIAVADCGRGIADHLARAHAEASRDDLVALGLAMRAGVTGALSGMYGTPDNAGAGLFITRSIAKGTGGYFLLVSGSAAYRLRRASRDEEQLSLFLDAFDERRFDRWKLPAPWQGTAVAVEVRMDRIGDYEGFFQWIFRHIPRERPKERRIRFT